MLNQPIIVNDNPQFASSVSDDINKWLIGQGAHDIYEIFRLNNNKFHFIESILLADLEKICSSLETKCPPYSGGFWASFYKPAPCDFEYQRIYNYLQVIKATLIKQIESDLEKGLSFDEIKEKPSIICKEIVSIIDTSDILYSEGLTTEKADEIISKCNEFPHSLSKFEYSPV